MYNQRKIQIIAKFIKSKWFWHQNDFDNKIRQCKISATCQAQILKLKHYKEFDLEITVSIQLRVFLIFSKFFRLLYTFWLFRGSPQGSSQKFSIFQYTVARARFPDHERVEQKKKPSFELFSSRFSFFFLRTSGWIRTREELSHRFSCSFFFFMCLILIMHC